MSNASGGILDRWLRFAQYALGRDCVLCAARTAHAHFCAGCEASLPRLPQARCARCALPLTAGSTCGACLVDPPWYDSVHAPYVYAFPVDALIHSFKYRGNLHLAPVFASALAQMSVQPVDAVIPMPLAAERLRERGFNQAQELARILGRRCGVPVLAQACRKVTNTAPQAALPWKERARNVRASFVCDADLRGLRVAIVDDVMTTGATLNELSRNVKRAGASYVTGWMVARTLRNGAHDAVRHDGDGPAGHFLGSSLS